MWRPLFIVAAWLSLASAKALRSGGLFALAHGAASMMVACPDGWTHGAGRCYKLTDASLTALGCVELCGENASLACLRSAEENAAATALLVSDSRSSFAWIGNYQRLGSVEPDGGGDVCASGEAVNYTNWAPGQPAVNYISREDCAVIYHDGGWEDMGLSSVFPLSCLCELGAEPKPEYLAFLDAQLQALRDVAAALFGGLVPALWLLPALTVLGYQLCHRLKRFSRRVLASTSQIAATPTPLFTSAAVLDAAENAARVRHAHVASTTTQLGWMLFVLFLVPNFAAADLTPVIGRADYYHVGVPWALALLLLTLRPIDAAAIRAVGILCFFLAVVAMLGFVYRATDQSLHLGNPITIGTNAAVALVFLASAALLWPVLVCDGCSCPAAMRMPPRRMLLRLWLVYRFLFCGLAACDMSFFFLLPISTGEHIVPTWRADDARTALLAGITSFLLSALVVTPANRGHFLHSLAAITNTRGSRENEAASVASLLTNCSAAATLAAGTERFRALRLASLTRVELANSTPDPALYAKTEPATLGSVHSFLSHSWGDDGDTKFDKLHEWVNARQVKADEWRVWLDKACIADLDLDMSLTCLPVFLSSCEFLLVLAGPTYSSRLWCLLEMFLYVQMGGDRERISVQLLSDDAKATLTTVSAARAQCFDPRERQRLLAVIESAFGNLGPFDEVLRHVLSTTIAEHVVHDAAPEVHIETVSSSLTVYLDESSIFALLEGNHPPVRLLSGAWLLKRAERIRAAEGAEARAALALRRRQDMERDEPDAFMEAQTLRSLPRGRSEGGAALPLICVSHAWHGSHHPDPHGDNLCALADAIENQQLHSWQHDALPKKFAVFFDYACMYQWERSTEEDAAFDTAISQMQVLYAHKKTLVYMLTRHPQWTVSPTWGCKEYLDRGWPNFEQRVTMLLKMQSSLAWANVVNVGTADDGRAKMLVPLTPEAFQRLLDTKTFTNGSDKEFVAGLYRKTIEDALSQTRELRYVKQDWRDRDVQELVQVLPLCTELRRLALDDNDKLTVKSARLIAKALEAGAAPHLTHLGHEAGPSFSSCAVLREACKARGIVLTMYAGIKGNHQATLNIKAPRRRHSLYFNLRAACAAGVKAPTPSAAQASRKRTANDVDDDLAA